MHEFSIAVKIVSELESIASENGANRITSVTVTAGEMRQIVPDAMTTAFEAASEGTVAAGSELVLKVVPMSVECRLCSHEYTPADGCYVCPSCGGADVRILKGNELLLEAVELEKEGD